MSQSPVLMSEKAPPLSYHLQELRSRILFCLGVFCIFFILCLFLSDFILEVLSRPISKYLKTSEGRLIFTAPMDEFLSHIKIAGFSAAAASFPAFFYQAFCFLAPGLYKKEKQNLKLFSLLSGGLFFAGLSFIYFVVYPLSFEFLMGGARSLPLISIKEYLSFYIQTSLAFGFLFQTPLVVFLLQKTGVLSLEQIKKSRPYALLVLSILSAFLTPPDVLSMLFLLIPLYLLFEFSILFSIFFERKK